MSEVLASVKGFPRIIRLTYCKRAAIALAIAALLLPYGFGYTVVVRSIASPGWLKEVPTTTLFPVEEDEVEEVDEVTVTDEVDEVTVTDEVDEVTVTEVVIEATITASARSASFRSCACPGTALASTKPAPAAIAKALGASLSFLKALPQES